MNKIVIEGIVFQSTPEHGYYILSDERMAQIPAALLTPSRFYDGGSTFEEDAEWARFALAFPDELPDLQAPAEKALRNTHPDIWEAWKGQKLGPGQSYQRDRQTLLATHADDPVVTSAWGSWHSTVPDNMVGAMATPGKYVEGHTRPEKTWWLVDLARYQARADMLYVVDPALDIAWADHA